LNNQFDLYLLEICQSTPKSTTYFLHPSKAKSGGDSVWHLCNKVINKWYRLFIPILRFLNGCKILKFVFVTIASDSPVVVLYPCKSLFFINFSEHHIWYGLFFRQWWGNSNIWGKI